MTLFVFISIVVMEDHGSCSACKKTINGTYVSCSHCLLARICTRCYLKDIVHHDHYRPEKEQPVIPIHAAVDKPRRIYATAKMFSSENGRGRGDDSYDVFMQ